MGDGNRGHALGKDAPHLLLRRATCIEGEVELSLEYVPRPEYGLVHPLLDAVDGGVAAFGGADVLVLSCPVALTVDQSAASGQLQLRRGESAGFALHHADAGRDAARPRSGANPRSPHGSTTPCRRGSRGRSSTRPTWVRGETSCTTADGCSRRSPSQPTGAICAAATTSLPEVVGGARNWDYRYAWVRDASFTIEALWVAACPDEANEFFDYVTTSAAGSLDRGGDLQIMFGIGGERDLTERELPHLEGWRHSAPVRVGNGAWNQRQLDVYGELLSAVYRLSDHLFDNASRVGPTGRPRQVGCASRSGAGHTTVLRPTGRHRRPALAGKGPRDLGGSRRASRLLVLQADVLGGPRPGGGLGRPSRRLRPSRAMEADPGPDP